MYPHQVLMQENNLEKKDLSIEAQSYLKDFNHTLRGIALKESRAEKKGLEFEINESDANKLKRFSKSVCIQIYEDMNTTYQKAQEEKENQKKMQEEALLLKKQQEEEDAQRLAETEAKAKAEAEAEAKKKQEEGGLFDYYF